MKTSYLLGALLSGALTASGAMAENDFHALSQMPTNLPAMAEGQLATVEGGNSCSVNIAALVGAVQTCANVGIVGQANVAGLALLQANGALVLQNIQ